MTTRPLLHSEYQILREAIGNADASILRESQVLDENVVPTRRGHWQWFNTDFSLWFQSSVPPRQDRTVHVLPVRQDSIGAEFFVTTQKNGTPVLLQLIGGESIPKSSFRDEINRVDDVLGRCGELERANKIWEFPFLRVVNLKAGIAFLASTTVELAPLVRLPSRVLISVTDTRLFLRGDASDNILLDGFLSWQAQRRPLVLDDSSPRVPTGRPS